jgi:hypothetical protein
MNDVVKQAKAPISVGEQTARRFYRRIGLANGLIIGLALAAGIWAPEAAKLADLPMPLQFPSLFLGGGLLLFVCGFTGWLSSRLDKTVLTVLLWLAASILCALIIGYQPFYGRSLVVWLADLRFWGRLVYPFVGDASPLVMIVAGIFTILALVFLAVLQGYRLESVQREFGGRWLVARPWIMLLLPALLVAVSGMATGNIVGDPSIEAARIVDRAIQVGRTYEGDLFQLGLEDGLNYAAIEGVRQQMGDSYSLIIGDIDPVIATTFVVAHFDNSAWINCRVVNEQLSFCYDAAPPYTTGLASLLTGQEVPEDCRGCLPRVNDEWRSWFETQHEQFSETPSLTRVAQWGKYVLMRADAADGDHTVECWFEGISPVRLTQCTVETGQD